MKFVSEMGASVPTLSCDKAASDAIEDDPNVKGPVLWSSFSTDQYESTKELQNNLVPVSGVNGTGSGKWGAKWHMYFRLSYWRHVGNKRSTCFAVHKMHTTA